MKTEIVNAEIEIEVVDLGNVEQETKQSPGFTVYDNPFGLGPWHRE